MDSRKISLFVKMKRGRSPSFELFQLDMYVKSFTQSLSNFIFLVTLNGKPLRLLNLVQCIKGESKFGLCFGHPCLDFK